jgi:hypothetical protein
MLIIQHLASFVKPVAEKIWTRRRFFAPKGTNGGKKFKKCRFFCIFPRKSKVKNDFFAYIIVGRKNAAAQRRRGGKEGCYGYGTA